MVGSLCSNILIFSRCFRNFGMYYSARYPGSFPHRTRDGTGSSTCSSARKACTASFHHAVPIVKRKTGRIPCFALPIIQAPFFSFRLNFFPQVIKPVDLSGCLTQAGTSL